MDGSGTEPQHWHFIDTLRALAILGVIAFHTAEAMRAPGGWLRGPFGHGLFGVQLFFLASALTLSLSLNSRSQKETYAHRNFFIRRFFRIAPLYYCGILFYAIYDERQCTFRWPLPDHLPGYVINGLLLHGWSPHWMNNIVPGGWSIGTEVSFYVIFPVLFCLLKDSFLRTLCAWVVATMLGLLVSHGLFAMIPGADRVWVGFVYQWLPTQLPVFLLGLVLFHMIQGCPLNTPNLTGTGRSIASIICLVVAAVLFLLANQVLGWSGNMRVAPPLYGASFCCLGFALYLQPWKFLVNPVMVFLGKLSYSLYITHFIAVYWIAPKTESLLRGGIANIPFVQDIILVSCFLAVTLVSVGFSLVTYHAIEQPCIQLGRRLIKRWNRHP